VILLDTDIMIEILRGRPAALEWLRTVTPEAVALPGFVAMELIQGCRNGEERRIVEREALHWPTNKGCERALRTFARHSLSHGLGLLDALIAETAIEAEVPLYSFNVRHYACVDGLTVRVPYVRT
jgi:predicted nucleic acid-binding protein